MSRSTWKGFFINRKFWLNCVFDFSTINKSKALKKQFLHFLSSGCRSSTVLPLMVGLRFNLYNGLKNKQITITTPMFGAKFGSLITNKEICVFKRKQNKRKSKAKVKSGSKSKSVTKPKQTKKTLVPPKKRTILSPFDKKQKNIATVARVKNSRNTIKERGSDYY